MGSSHDHYILSTTQERVSYPIANDSLSPVEVLPIGRTAIMRGGFSPADDRGFSDRLARGRDTEFLRRSILALIWVVVIFEVIEYDGFIGNDSDYQRFSRYLILDFSPLFWKNTLGLNECVH